MTDVKPPELGAMDDQQLIEHTTEYFASDSVAYELADRLHAAIAEIERMTATIKQLEAACGTNP